MKILVALDGSRRSESILPLAGRLAQLWQAELLVLRVVDPTIGSGADPLAIAFSESAYQQILQDADDYLQGLVPQYPDIPMRPLREVGDPGACIQAVAHREECGLIMMATHGHSGFARWLWGSVAEGVSRHAPCPTLLIRSPETPTVFHKILIPTDGSAASLEVPRHVGLFLSPETRVTLLHCGGPAEEMAEKLRQQVDGRPWMSLDLVATPAPQGILQWASEHHCDLIALSSHGRDGFDHLWNGSVTEEVARHSKCPVLVFGPAALQHVTN